MAKKLTLTQIVNDTEMKSVEKLELIAAVVVKARKAYGNSEVEIECPEVNTCEGIVNIKFLSEDGKAALAGREITAIRMAAIEATTATEGAVLDREVERLIAVNPVLANLLAESESAYI